MRIFFGLEPDAATIMQIADWRDRELSCPGTPVPPRNFHITLAFVGEIEQAPLERLCTNLEQALLHHHYGQQELLLDRVGYWQKPGIFWLGSSCTPAAIEQLAGKLGTLASAEGGRRDRKPLQPHITLYRRCSAPPPAPTSVPAVRIPCTRLTLFESTQGRQGVHYSALRDWELC